MIYKGRFRCCIICIRRVSILDEIAFSVNSLCHWDSAKVIYQYLGVWWVIIRHRATLLLDPRLLHRLTINPAPTSYTAHQLFPTGRPQPLHHAPTSPLFLNLYRYLRLVVRLFPSRPYLIVTHHTPHIQILIKHPLRRPLTIRIIIVINKCRGDLTYSLWGTCWEDFPFLKISRTFRQDKCRFWSVFFRGAFRETFGSRGVGIILRLRTRLFVIVVVTFQFLDCRFYIDCRGGHSISALFCCAILSESCLLHCFSKFRFSSIDTINWTSLGSIISFFPNRHWIRSTDLILITAAYVLTQISIRGYNKLLSLI